MTQNSDADTTGRNCSGAHFAFYTSRDKNLYYYSSLTRVDAFALLCAIIYNNRFCIHHFIGKIHTIFYSQAECKTGIIKNPTKEPLLNTDAIHRDYLYNFGAKYSTVSKNIFGLSLSLSLSFPLSDSQVKLHGKSTTRNSCSQSAKIYSLIRKLAFVTFARVRAMHTDTYIRTHIFERVYKRIFLWRKSS